MRKRMASLGRKVGGWVLVVLGIAGCVLPVIPGIPLLLAGLALLATEYAWAKVALARLKSWVDRARGKTAKQDVPEARRASVTGAAGAATGPGQRRP